MGTRTRECRPRHGLGLLLGSSSAAALLIGGGTPAALAACANNINASFDNPLAATTPCVAVTNTSFTGNITNEGSITPGGITFTNGTISGFISSSGIIAGGIALDGASLIASAPNAIQITGPTFLGGIGNAGTISSTAASGVFVNGVTTFGDGIVNAGSIAGRVHAIDVDTVATFAGGINNAGTLAITTKTTILVNNVTAFSGGITNSGTLSSGLNGIGAAQVGTFFGGITNSGSILAGTNGILLGSLTTTISTFTGGITNSGNILAGANGIQATHVTTFGASSAGGGIVNSGTIRAGRDGIDVGTVATFLGGITNAGTISGAAHAIDVDTVVTFAGGINNAGTLAITTKTTILVNNVTAFSGGITNSGTLSSGLNGIGAAQVGTFFGGITNSGSILAGTNGILLGSLTTTISTFTGSITNSGNILAGANGIQATHVTTFGASSAGGGIVNSGTIRAGRDGIDVGTVATFLGGITNAGTISGAAHAIDVDTVVTFAGGINNAGTLAITTKTTILVNNVTAFSGGITNSGTLSSGLNGIGAAQVGTFFGGITNSGSILAGANGILLGSLTTTISTFTGGITNSGNILAGANGIQATHVTTFGATSAGGGIVNSGTIRAGRDGIDVGTVATFLGGITNAGHITAGATGILVMNVVTFAGGISNAGVISANIGVLVGFVSTFSGGITNSGTIASANTAIVVAGANFVGGHIANTGTIAGGFEAIDLQLAQNAITIDQNGGLMTGAIMLSSLGDTLNIRGGAINGNIVGQNAGDTINFALGAGTFTYGSAFGFSGISQVNVNSGIVVLDGASSASNIAVHGGVLQVGDAASPGATLTGMVDVTGGALAGHGSVIGGVAIENGGTLAPGGSIGTLTVGGALTLNPGSTYLVQVLPGAGNNSKTQVNGAPGTATINGGTVIVQLQLGHYDATTYTIVSATGGVSGRFAGLAFGAPFGFSGGASLSFDPNDVFLNLGDGFVLLAPPGANRNQQNVANGINGPILAGQMLPSQFGNLINLPNSGLLNALTQLSGENNAGFFQGAFQAGNSFLNLMVNPFVDGRFGNDAFGPAVGYAAEERPAYASAIPVKAAPASFASRYGVWAAAYGGSASIDGNAVTGSHTTTATAAAFAAGVDYRISPDTTVGFALAGGGTSWGLDAGLGGGHSDMFQAGVYGTHRFGNAYLSGALAYNFHDVTTNRTVTIAGTDMLSARFQANGVGARIEGGYRVTTPVVGITPYAAAQVQSIALPNYGETASSGSNQFALNFASQTATTTRAELGTWLDKTTLLDRGALMTLYGRIAWAHDFGDTPSANAIFQTLPGANFIVNGAAPARDGALVTAGAQYKLVNGWSFLAKFDGEFSDTTSIYSGAGMVRKTW